MTHKRKLQMNLYVYFDSTMSSTFDRVSIHRSVAIMVNFSNNDDGLPNA